MDSRATKQDKGRFGDCPRFCRKFMVNSIKEDVPGVGSYQIKLRSGCKMILHDLLYLPSIQHSLLSIDVVLGLSFAFKFSGVKH